MNRCQETKTQTAEQLQNSLKKLNVNTHQKYEHDLEVNDDEVDKCYQQLKSNKTQHLKALKNKKLHDATQLEITQLNDQHQEIFNLMAKSLSQRRQEMQNIIELNKDRYEHSPYTVKKLQLRPPLIYAKDNHDQLFLMSEADKFTKTFSSSHHKVYGRPLTQERSVRNQNNKYIRRESIISNAHFEYKNVNELKHHELKQRENSQTLQEQKYMDKPIIIEQNDFTQKQIEQEEKKLLKQALILKKKDQSLAGYSFGQTIISPDKQQEQSILKNQNASMAKTDRVNVTLNQQNLNETTLSSEQQIKEQSMTVYKNIINGNILRKSKVMSQRDSLSRGSSRSQSRSQAPQYFKRQRYSFLQNEDAEIKDYQRKLNQLKSNTVKKIFRENMNIKLPNKWRHQKYVEDLTTLDKQLTDTTRLETTQRSLIQAYDKKLYQDLTTRSYINNPTTNQRSKTPLNYRSPYGDQSSTLKSNAQLNNSLGGTFTQTMHLNLQKTERPSVNTTILIAHTPQKSNQLRKSSNRSLLLNQSFSKTATSNNLGGERSPFSTIYPSQLQISGSKAKNQMVQLETETSQLNPRQDGSFEQLSFISQQNPQQHQQPYKSNESMRVSQISINKDKIKTLQYPFNNYCRPCGKKNQEFFAIVNQQFLEVQSSKNGRKFLINSNQLLNELTIDNFE